MNDDVDGTMFTRIHDVCLGRWLPRLLGLALIFSALNGWSAGVTIITHGYNGDVNGWVSGMANEAPAYPIFPGTNFTGYTMVITYSGGSYFVSTTRTSGAAPTLTDSGEIIVKLDWSQVAGGVFSTYSTYDVAGAAASALLLTNQVAELGGHSLLEFPVHLVGHSRGGSLVSEISRLLGTNGIWVDHLTTLDPHPLNNDGFSDVPSGVDAPVHSYANVLFHDNYWQNLGDGLFDPIGERVNGAYVRQLTSLAGGYGNTSSVSPYHSNVHLWYHGTMNLATPASDTEASIGAAERSSWWVGTEAHGAIAGFYYSLIGQADRLSTFQPLGPGFSAIRDGYNQWWDLGAGVSSNRTGLPSNSGTWPSLIKLDRTDTNAVVQGQSTSVKFYYQWAKPAGSQASLAVYLDDDRNPLNGNARLISLVTLPGTGASAVSSGTLNLNLNVTNAPVGRHAFFAKLSGDGRTRYLYAPGWLDVLPAPAPALGIVKLSSGQFQIAVTGVAGEQLVLQSSFDLLNWQPLATNTLSGTRWNYSLASGTSAKQYFRALRF